MNTVDSIRTKAILESIPDELLLAKLEKSSDGDAYSALGELASISPEKIDSIKRSRKVEYKSEDFEKLDLRAIIIKIKTGSKESAISTVRNEESIIIDKLSKESIKEIAIFLSNLSELSDKLSKQLFLKLNDDSLKLRIEKENFNQIGIAINLFTKLEKNKTFKICEELDFSQIAKKTEKLNLATIQNGLREINGSNNFLAFQLFNRLTNDFLKLKFEQADFRSVGEAASNLIKINRQKTIELIKLIPDEFFKTLISDSDYTYQQFATTIEKLTQIDFGRFANITRDSDTEKIASKILASINKTGQQIFIHHFPTLANIDWKITNKIVSELSTEYLYNLLRWESLDLYTVNLPSLKLALDHCKKTEESKFIEGIINKNKYRFDKYRKQNYKKHLT